MVDIVLAVVAHGDDEVLGCGGALRAHANKGDKVYVHVLADGESSRIDKKNIDECIENREKSIKKANSVLGVEEVYIDRLPDNRMDSLDRIDIVQKIEERIEAIKPSLIYTHHSGDVNVDHRRVHEAVVTACRPQVGCPVKTLLFFETVSSTEWQTPSSNTPFVPNWFVDVSETLKVKLEALEVYSSEVREWPHPRSYKGVEYLAKWRGATVGVEAAEAFVLGRKIS